MNAHGTSSHLTDSPLDRLFFRHPREQGETYLEHFKVASRLAVMSGVGAICMIVHAIVPGVNLFETIGTCSTTYYRNILDMITRNSKNKSR